MTGRHFNCACVMNGDEERDDARVDDRDPDRDSVSNEPSTDSASAAASALCKRRGTKHEIFCAATMICRVFPLASLGAMMASEVSERPVGTSTRSECT